MDQTGAAVRLFSWLILSGLFLGVIAYVRGKTWGELQQDVQSVATDKRAPHPFRWFACIGLTSYLIASFLPALIYSLPNSLEPNQWPLPGGILLLFGWQDAMRVFDYGHYSGAVGWFANPCFALGTLALLYGERRFALVLCFAAAIIAPLSFNLQTIHLGPSGPANVIGYSVGFWIWIGSIWMNFIVAVLVLALPAAKSGLSRAACPADD